MNVEDLVAAIREHHLEPSLVALYLSLQDDSSGPSADLGRAHRLCAAASTLQPVEG